MPLAGDRIVTIRLKHDGQALLFAFEGLTAEPFLVPEVLLDLDSDKSADWRQDDWWFHASFTDCSSRGRFNDWDSCVPEASAWEANNLAESPGGETVFPAAFEISIPFATLDWTPAPGAVIGLAFNLTDTASDSRLWPAGARLEDPSSWGEAVVADGR